MWKAERVSELAAFCQIPKTEITKTVHDPQNPKAACARSYHCCAAAPPPSRWWRFCCPRLVLLLCHRRPLRGCRLLLPPLLVVFAFACTGEGVQLLVDFFFFFILLLVLRGIIVLWCTCEGRMPLPKKRKWRKRGVKSQSLRWKQDEERKRSGENVQGPERKRQGWSKVMAIASYSLSFVHSSGESAPHMEV